MLLDLQEAGTLTCVPTRRVGLAASRAETVAGAAGAGVPAWLGAPEAAEACAACNFGGNGGSVDGEEWLVLDEIEQKSMYLVGEGNANCGRGPQSVNARSVCEIC